jgi:hypothetical protein
MTNHFSVYHDPKKGWLFAGTNASRKSWYPEVEGQPFLKGIPIYKAQYAGGILALNYRPRNSADERWCLVQFDRDLVSLLNTEVRSVGVFQLAPDGKSCAVKTKRGHVKLIDLATKQIFMSTERAGIQSSTNLFLGRRRLVFIDGRRRLDFNWAEGELAVSVRRSDPDLTLEPEFVIAGGPNHPLIHYDPGRFTAVASNSLDVIVDRANHLIVYDPQRLHVVCIFWIRGGNWVAWMPDGTRYGPRYLLGATPTPGALARIAEALREASGPSGRVSASHSG